MSKGIRIILELLVVLILMIGFSVAWFDWNKLHDTIVDAVNDRTGRTVEIHGDIDVRLSMTPVITIDGIVLSNAEWASADEMLRLKRLRVSIRLWELLRGRVVLPLLELEQPILNLEKNSEGDVNWQFDPGLIAEAAVPETRSEFPVIGKLQIREGLMHYQDATSALDFEGEITTVAGHGGDVDDAIELTASGRLQERPFKLELRAGSLLDLRDEDQLYPVQLTLSVADTKIAIDGTIDRPLQLRGLDLTVNAQGPDLSRLYELTGAILPGTPPYKISGQLVHRDDLWQIESLHGEIGDSDIAGDFALDTGSERYRISANLHSERLDFDDLGPLIGAPPSTGPGETISEEQQAVAKKMRRKGKVIPDEAFNLDRLRDADADVRFSAREVLAPNIPLEGLDFELTLQDGVMTIEPLHLAIAGGAIAGSVILDATQKEINWQYDLALDALKIGKLADVAGAEDIAGGTLDGSIVMHSRGNSMHDTAANGDGRIELNISGGRLSSLLIEIIGLDVAESLGWLLTDADHSIPFRCAAGVLILKDGMVETEYLIVDTADTRIDAELSANLEDESYALTLHPSPKDASPFSVRAPLHVDGSFKEANVRPDVTSLGLRATAAIALGTLATPAAALLAFIEPGPGQDADCRKFSQSQLR